MAALIKHIKYTYSMLMLKKSYYSLNLATYVNHDHMLKIDS